MINWLCHHRLLEDKYDLLQAVGRCIAYLKAFSHSASAEERARSLDESSRPSYNLDCSELASSCQPAPGSARGASASTQSCADPGEHSRTP